ncbi:MAG: NAD(P)-dependent oxidoreductase [Patescibacteria group bacterium]
MKTIAITGASGLIGTRILEILGIQYIFIPIPQGEVDITDKTTIEKFLEGKHFDYLLHLAAYTNVDGAEKDRKLCEDINVLGTQNIFDVCKAKRAKFIHISTDFVFDGRKIDDKVPSFDEYTTPNPVSFYGKTKYDAEKIVEKDAMIIRLSYPYRKDFEIKKDFVRTIKSLLESGKEVKMIDDSLITPTYIDDLANALGFLIENYSKEVFHLVGSDSMSPYEAGIRIAKHYKLDDKLIKPVSYDEYFKNKAQRPQYAKIVVTKNIGLKMKTLEEGLKDMDS